jgi:hypothetical protein
MNGFKKQELALHNHLNVSATALWMLTLSALALASSGAQAQSISFGSVALGVPSAQQSVTVTAQVAGTVSTVEVLTLGVSGLDFAPGAGAMTCASATLAAGATCSESVTFTPAYPGLRMGAVVLVGSGNQVLGTAYLSGTGTAGLGVLVTGNILPVAGDGVYEGPVLDGVVATSASLNHPSAVTLDGAGNMYIADRYHNRIRKVIASTGIISTLAGNGDAAYTGDGLTSTNSAVSVNTPWGVALDGAGNVYIADTGNNVVRRIAAATGIISTVAGDGSPGSSGDSGPATSAALNQPQGVSVDLSGNLYIADTYNQRIRKVNAVTGVITTVAGTGFTNPSTGTGGYTGDGGLATSAELNFPFAVAFDAAGNMYIPDSANNVVRMVNGSNIISTFAGTGAGGDAGDGGAATAATLFSPSGVIADAAGNVYIADTQNASIRKVNSTTGFIFTIAKNGVGEYVFNGAGPYNISIYGPIGLYLDGSGDLFFADSLNMRVREIQSNFAILDFAAKPVRQGDLSATQTKAIENDGNAPLDLATITAQANAALDSTATTCTTGSPLLGVDADCEIGAIFAPTMEGNPLFGNIVVAGDTVNSPLDIELIGNATLVTSTTTTLVSNPNPSAFGASVSFTATVVTGAGTGNLTGTVSFLDGTTGLAAKIPVGASVTSGNTTTATASFSTAALAVGLHSITASYSNTLDPTHFDSTSAILVQTVLESTATTLVSSANPSAVGQSVTFTATVAALAGGTVPPDGTVTFADGSTTLNVATLSAGGVATYTTAALANGLHSITATYSGDSAQQISVSVSKIVKQDVLAPSLAVVTSAPNPSFYGNPVIFSVTVTSSAVAAPTGVVEILDGGKQIGTANLVGSTGAGTFTTSSLAVGSHIVTAAYMGDGYNRAFTSAAITQVVNEAETSTTVTASPSPEIAGTPVAITATVKPAQGMATPSGNITFTDTFNGAPVALGSVAVGASGTAVLNPTLAIGTHSIVASYAGNANDAASASAPLALTVVIATTSAALASAPNPSITLSAVIFTATLTGNGGTPTGSITFLADGTSIGSSTLSAKGIATLTYSALKAGTHSITASYAGDTNDLASTSPAISQIVGTIPTVTALGASSTSGPDAVVLLLATVAGASGPTPTGTVTFSAGTTTLGSQLLNSTAVATLQPNLAPGTYSIVASYGGDALHSPSKSNAVSVSSSATSFTVTLNPPSVTMATTQNAVVTVHLASVAGFTDTIGLGCSSLPAGVTCHFSSPSVMLAANSSQTAQLTIDTNNPLTGGSSAMNTRPGNQSPLLAGLLLPLSVFFGCLFARFRKRRFGGLATMLLLCLAGAAMLVTGCTGYSQASAKPGTYVIQVNGTGVNSNITQYQNLTLNITK